MSAQPVPAQPMRRAAVLLLLLPLSACILPPTPIADLFPAAAPQPTPPAAPVISPRPASVPPR